MPNPLEEAMVFLNRARSDLGQAAAIIEREKREAPLATGRSYYQHQALGRVFAFGGPLTRDQIWAAFAYEAKVLFGGSSAIMRNFLEANSSRYARRGEHWGMASWADPVWEPLGQHREPLPPATSSPAPRAFRPPNVVAKTVVTAGRLIAELGRPVTTMEVVAAFKAEHGYEPKPANVSGYLSSSRHRFKSGPGGWALTNTEAEKEDTT